MGVMGSVSLVQSAVLSSQPVSSFDWHPDKVSMQCVCVLCSRVIVSVAFCASGSVGSEECSAVWHGMVWCGVTWCGVAWCGVAWCGMV